MRKAREKDVRQWRPARLFALAASGLLSIAVTYNALFAQPEPRLLASGDLPGTTQGGPGSASGGSTIQLKYDPVIESIQRQLNASG